jgi:hypothetical protein
MRISLTGGIPLAAIELSPQAEDGGAERFYPRLSIAMIEPSIVWVCFSPIIKHLKRDASQGE